MALLWCDGFDHYGVVGNLTEGAWAELTSFTLTTLNPRTGTHTIRRGDVTQPRLRRVLGGAKTAVGIGGVFYLAGLPTSNDRFHFFHFQDAANANQVTVTCQSTGVVSVYRGVPDTGSGTLLAQSASPVITAEAFQHVEAFVEFDNSAGSVEVRVNGVTACSAAGVDTVNTSNVECSQVYIASRTAGTGTAGTGAVDVDDVFCYDDTGSFNNTFLGDRRVITLFPNADTLQADWTPVGESTGYECIDEANPDFDTTYISAAPPGSPGQLSEFGLQDLPAGVSVVSAVEIVNFSRKTEAGPANITAGIVSNSVPAAGTDQPMTEIYTYRSDVFETDPDTAAPFTPEAVDDLLVSVERTA